MDGRATERILVVEIKIKPKFKPYIQVICLCLNPSDGVSLANFNFDFFNFELREFSTAGYQIVEL